MTIQYDEHIEDQTRDGAPAGRRIAVLSAHTSARMLVASRIRPKWATIS